MTAQGRTLKELAGKTADHELLACFPSNDASSNTT